MASAQPAPADTTAALLGTDITSRNTIREDMKNAYSIRSDASPGDGLNYPEAVYLGTDGFLVPACGRIRVASVPQML